MRTSLRQIAAITRKELQLLWTDWPALALLFLMPIFFIVVMSFALQSVFGAGSAEQPISVLVVNQDQGDLGDQVFSGLRELEGLVLLDQEEGRALQLSRAEELIRERRYPLALVIASDFSQSVTDGSSAVAVSLLADPATNLQMVAPLRGVVQGYLERLVLLERLPGKVRQAIQEMASEQGGVAAEDLLAGVDRGVRDKLAALGGGSVDVAIAAPRGMARVRRPTATEQSVPAYAIFGVFFITLTLATSFVRDRENGIEIRLRAAPVSGPVLLIGKLLPYYLVNLVQTALMFAAGVAVFSLDLGNLGALVAVSMAVAGTANGLGLLIAAVATTEAQVGALAVLLSVTLAALGGLMVPSFVMPEGMRAAAQLTPHFWALQGFHGAMLRGEGAFAVGGEIVRLVGFAIVFFALALWLFTKR